MLATDGFGNAQRRQDWDDAFGADLASLIQRHGDGWVAKALPEWVRDCASRDGSGDDVTAVLLFAADTPWLAPAEPRSWEAPAATTEPPAAAPLIPTQRSRPASHRLVSAPRSSQRLRLPRNRLIAVSALVSIVLAAGIGIWLGMR
jgi:hypothetical protein